MQRWYGNKRQHRRNDPEDGSSSSSPGSSRGTRAGGPDPGFAGTTAGGDLQVRHSRTQRGRLPVVLGLVALGALLGAGLLTLAVAQSGRAALSLNSPASFPVDI